MLEALGARALEALGLLLQSVEHADERSGALLLRRVDDDSLYAWLLRVVLGLIALDCAGQRGLLPLEPGEAGSEWERFVQRCRIAYDGAHGTPAHQARLFDAERLALSAGGPPIDDETMARVRLLLATRGPEASELNHRELPLETLGQLYERLIGYRIERADRRPGRIVAGRGRKQSGSFFTPRALAEQVVEKALAPFEKRLEIADRGERVAMIRALRVCDPAMGAGVFLLESCRQLGALLSTASRDAGPELSGREALRAVALECLYGVDRSELAVGIAELSVWLLVGDPDMPVCDVARHLRTGDSLMGDGIDGRAPQGEADRALSKALVGKRGGSLQSFEGGRLFHWALEFPDATAGFDVVVGNPPWVAFAGRAAQPLDPRVRRYFRQEFRAMHGYPTLHGLFIERASGLAPRGVVALLVPSPVADLDGYRSVRRALTSRHRVREPLLELGQDAFASVVQPCFVLVADPDPGREPDDRAWQLAERQRAAGSAEAVQVPEILSLVASGPPLPAMAFREMGFQSSRIASHELMLRAPEPDRRHRYPLLEGRDVSEFSEGPPRLYLCTDPAELSRARCRVREQSAYRQARFVVRQTAEVPIAALHSGLPFRNSLLAGLEVDGLPAELLVALLNSALYRAIHLSTRRDARQAAFPQVKLAHLRALPRPPDDPRLHQQLLDITRTATQAGVSPGLRRKLDDAVFDLFAVPADHRREVWSFLAARTKRFGYAADADTPRRARSPLHAVRERLSSVT